MTTSDSAAFVRGGGTTGALIRSIEWRATPLGPANQWPQSLRTAINICVSSRFPIALYWGPEYVMLYNDDLIPMVGANKHPAAMGRPAFEVLPEIRTIIEPMLDKVMTTGEAIWSEDLMLPLFRNDGQSESYFTFTYSPIYNEAGAVAGVFCAVLETTDRIIEERRLRLLNALAQITSAQTPADACGQAAAQLARSPNDVPFALLYLVDEAVSGFRLAGVANLESGTAWAPESIGVGDGSIWPLDASATRAPLHVDLQDAPNAARGAVILPIERAAGGPPLGFLVAGLSALLPSSEYYDRFHRLLASSISQGVSNAAAYEAERRRAEELARLDRAKTVFFSNVSHEFRTPLTLMLAPIQDMLAASPGTAIDPASVQLLQRNAVRLLKLVNTLLEFSRLEAGRIEVVFEPVDVSALTADLASNFRGAIERAGLALHVDSAVVSEPVYVDRGMWEKIVLNLLSNALKFTFDGAITVRLRSEAGAVCLEVEDTGTGIRPEDLPRLFERFHRIEDARSRSHEGSGIGLALIQEFVKLHGGEISVASTVGVGSTFRVRIPTGKAHLDPDRIRASRTLPPTTGGSDAFLQEAMRWGAQASDTSAVREHYATASEERILFADDNADMREYVARLLSERWHVELASDGDEALSAIRRNSPDLVLCDAMMPGLDGFALLRAIRSDEGLRSLPVIMLSARASEEDAAKGLTAGANDYISKPFSARDLLVRVATNLAASKAARENVLARHTAEAAERTQRSLLEFQERFVAVLGHDLRSPIYAINMAAGLLTQLSPRINDELATRTIKRLGSSSRRMAKMVDQLMDLSRLRLGTGFTISPCESDLRELLIEVIEELRAAHSTRSVQLDCPAGIVGSWDRDRLEQVFSNLIGNAIHHGLPDTAITVSVHADGDAVRIEVHNQGAPIPEAIRETLFEPFRRGESVSRTNSAGLGLGLYISRELVHAHRGSIAVSSDAVHGTVFRVTLPRGHTNSP